MRPHVGSEVLSDDPRIRIAMDKRLRRTRQLGKGVALTGDVAEARAQSEDQVARMEQRQLRRRIGQPQIARIQRVAVRKQILPPKRHGDRKVPRLRERQQASRGPAERRVRRLPRSAAAALSPADGAHRGSHPVLRSSPHGRCDPLRWQSSAAGCPLERPARQDRAYRRWPRDTL